MNKLVLVAMIVLGRVAAAAPDQPAAPASATSAAREACVQAMNADPAFAQSIMESVDKRLEQRTLEAHQDAEHHIQKNERHVIYAYAAMWIIAALFVVFLWRRQQSLQTEIAGLRKDLEAAGKEKK